MAHMYPVLMEKRVDTVGAQMFRRMFELLAARAARDLPGKSPESVRVGLAQALSAAMFSVVAPSLHAHDPH